MSYVAQPQIVTGAGSTPIGPASGDLTGTYPAPGVIRINGAVVPAAGALTVGNVLKVSGTSAVTYGQLDLSNANSVINVLPVGNLPSLAGDVTGTITSNTAVKINGATVPVAGSLTTGNGLYVTGTSALSYSALNLAGGSNYVTGVLPTANQASQTMAGDVTGTTAASTVVKLQGNSVSSTAPTSGQGLIWNGTAWTPTSVIGAAFFPKLGRVLLVDDINGNDSTGVVNGLPFKTVAGAISYINSNSLTAVTIWIMPGTYNLSAGITIPNTCSIRGLQLQTVVLQMLNVSSTTTLVTMGENTRIEDVQLKLTSSAAVNLTGVHLPGTTSVTSKIRTCVITVDNSSISTASTTTVVGLLSDGTGVANAATFSFNVIKGSTINVLSNGGGLAAGIYQPSGAGSANQLSTRDVNIYVAAPSDLSSTGTYVGVYADNVNSQSQFRTTSISGVPYKGTTTNAAVRVLSLLNVASLSGTQTIQGVSLIAGDRILLAGQTTGSQNGIWVVQAGAWTRAADMAAGSNANGSWVPISEGNFADQSWLCTTAPAVVGTNSLVFRKSYCGDNVKVNAHARYTGGAPTGSRAAQGTYTPVNNHRILLDNAANPVDNGLWNYNSAGAWTRALDMPTGANSLNSYVLVLYGTDTSKAYICTTTGTVGTDNLTFAQKYLGVDVIQNAPQSGNLTNGIQVGPGTDLVSKSGAGKPFTTFVYPTTLLFGLNGNIQSGTHYLWPGVLTTDDNTQIFYRFQQRSIVQGMSVNCRTAPGSTTVTVNVLKSQSGIAGTGVVTPMSVTFTDGILAAENYVTSVDFEEGTYLSVQIVADGGVNGADLIVEIDAF